MFVEAPRTGVEHHEYRVEALTVFADLLHEGVGQPVIRSCPDIDYLVKALLVRDETHLI